MGVSSLKCGLVTVTAFARFGVLSGYKMSKVMIMQAQYRSAGCYQQTICRHHQDEVAYCELSKHDHRMTNTGLLCSLSTGFNKREHEEVSALNGR
jgi:hypothetical protein